VPRLGTRLVLPNLGPYVDEGEDELEACARVYWMLWVMKGYCAKTRHKAGFGHPRFLSRVKLAIFDVPLFMRSEPYLSRRLTSVPKKHISGELDGSPPLKKARTSSIPNSSVSREAADKPSAPVEAESDEDERDKPEEDPAENDNSDKGKSKQEFLAKKLPQQPSPEPPGISLYWKLRNTEANEILKELDMWDKVEVMQEAEFDPRKCQSVNELKNAIAAQYKLGNIEGWTFTINTLLVSITHEDADKIWDGLYTIDRTKDSSTVEIWGRIRINLFTRDWKKTTLREE